MIGRERRCLNFYYVIYKLEKMLVFRGNIASKKKSKTLSGNL